ncbi:MAG: MFS transporter [Oscillospiraceae bacterium]|nr:MFS transporter [Oscillospiraceae bacterium]
MKNESSVIRKATPLGGRVWVSLLVFGFMGQIAWMVENVYFATYIQKNITAAGWATSATVAASAVAAALATLFSAAWSDRVGRRRAFVCWGYLLWGASTAAFALFGNGQVALGVGTAVALFVFMDCVMSAIGSAANDAAFSAWITDVTDVSNRGTVDIVLSIMPIAALIVIFAGFDGMTTSGNWTGFFLVLGGLTAGAGLLGLWIFRDSPTLRPTPGGSYLREVLYAFRPQVIRENKMIYVCFLGMMFSGLAMQMWQPYMISLVEVTLGIENYIVPIGIVVLTSAVISVLAGKAMDKFGKEKLYTPVALMQVLGGLLAYSIKFLGHAMALLCVGGTLIMAGNLMMAGLFTASSRDYTPEGRAGASQSVKMVIYIMLPMVLSSIIDPWIIKAAAMEPTAEILAKYPSYAGSYLYPYELFLGAAVAALFIFFPARIVRRDAARLRLEKIREMGK